jgi:membrane-bound lytic murein transglycosylase A
LRPHRRPGWWCWLACCALLLGAAAEAPPAARPVGFAELPGWPGEDPAAALPPLLKSCAVLRTGQTDSAARWARACAAAAALDPARLDAASARAFLERHFRPHALGTGLLTGYYEPELRGARRPGGEFRVPLHGLPPAGPLLQADRAAIEAGALAGRGLEIVYVDDPVDAFFLHIQGSGRVVLRDGGVLRLGFAGRNAHAYHAIGRSLIERGAIPREAMSMQAIRGWLAAAPPAEAAALMRENPAYIFFRPLTGLAAHEGPVGAQGVPLTPGRSLAVDRAFIPLGAPVFLASRDPVDGTPIRRVVLAQDTGTAIRGQARADLFWGWGADAATRAGLMREDAALFVLLPR